MNTKFWDSSDKCFISEPLVHYHDHDGGDEHGEVWFTTDHKHDIGAIYNNWYYILPFSSYLYPSNNNPLVNKNRLVADERGVDNIKIIPKEYTGNEPMIISIVDHKWTFS